MTELNVELVCVDCGADYRQTDQTDAERCAMCAAWHQWWDRLRGQGANA